MTGRLGLRGFDHIGIAVRSLESALPLYLDLLGGTFVSGADDPHLGIRTIQLRLPPGVRVELITPATDDCYLHDVLDRRGEGLHHVTVMVQDVEAAIRQLESDGYALVDTDLSDPSWRQTYVRPRSANGVLLQVVDSTHDWDTPADQSLEDVLAGSYVWDGETPRRRDDAG